MSNLICLQQDGKVYYSIDGNFGLCWKRSAGSSVRAPLHGQTMFIDQEKIDKYVQATSYRIQTPLCCWQFSSNLSRAYTKYDNLYMYIQYYEDNNDT